MAHRIVRIIKSFNQNQKQIYFDIICNLRAYILNVFKTYKRNNLNERFPNCMSIQVNPKFLSVSPYIIILRTLIH